MSLDARPWKVVHFALLMSLRRVYNEALLSKNATLTVRPDTQ